MPQRSPVRRNGSRTALDRARGERSTLTEEIDLTLIDWFLTLSPWQRLQASANWARLAALSRAESEND